jgi:hypothetical protein
LRLLRNVNDGNLVTWQKRLEDPSQKPIVDYVKEYNVDTKDPRAVRNFFERQRQDIGKHILFAIRGVEDKLSKKFGAPIKVEDLDPYGNEALHRRVRSLEACCLIQFWKCRCIQTLSRFRQVSSWHDTRF